MPKIEENPIQPPDYDQIAPDYDERYRQGVNEGIRRVVETRMASVAPGRWLEVGCGTGQWLVLTWPGILRFGLDGSSKMLSGAANKLSGVPLMQGDAVHLPIEAEILAGLAVINALHHFPDQDRFLQESLRVLQPGGGLLMVGLDAHDPDGQWYVYDYFEGTAERDRARYPNHQLVIERMDELGFSSVRRGVAHRIDEEIIGPQVLDQPFLQRRGCSQMALLSDEAYAAGIQRIKRTLAVNPEHAFTSSVRLEYLWGTK